MGKNDTTTVWTLLSIFVIVQSISFYILS